MTTKDLLSLTDPLRIAAASSAVSLAQLYQYAARHDEQRANDLAAGRTGDRLIDDFREIGVMAYRHDAPDIKTALDFAGRNRPPVLFLPADGSYDHIARNWIAANSAFRLRSTLDLERQRYRPAKGDKRR